MKKKIRWGGKKGGDHSTIIEPARRFVSRIAGEDSVARISPGFIASGKMPNGKRLLRIIEERGSLLLSVRGESAHQEIRIFTKNSVAAKTAIVAAAKAENFEVSQESRL
jgi:hypothetical protein